MRVYQDRESSEWVAEVTDLPGCIGVGDTPEQAVKAAKGFVRGWLDEAEARGWTVPEPTQRPEASGKFVVRLPRSLHAQLQELAEAEGTSLNQLVVSLLSERTTRRSLIGELQRLVPPPTQDEGWCVALYAFGSTHAQQRTRTAGTYSANLRYGDRPILVAEAPGFHGWAQQDARPARP